MKKHNLFKVVCIAILVTLVLTWILPTSYYQYSLVSDGTRTQAGIFDLFQYTNVSLSYFGNIAIFALAIGAFYGALNKTGAYNKLLKKIATKAKGNEKILLVLLIVLMSAFTAVCGATFGLWIVIPFVVALVIMLGYDKITAAFVTIGSLAVGNIGNIFSSTYLLDETGYSVSAENGFGVLNNYLSISAKSLVALKIVLFFVCLGILIFVTLKYSKNHGGTKEEIEEFASNDSSVSEKYKSIIPTVISITLAFLILAFALIPITLTIKSLAVKIIVFVVEAAILLFLAFMGIKCDKKNSIAPLIFFFDMTILVMLLSLTSWTSSFGVKIFANATNTIKNFEVSGFPILAKILGGVNPFEQWSIENLIALLGISAGIIALYYKVKFNDFIDGMLEGAKKALKPAIIIVMIYMVLVISNLHPVILTIIKPLVKSKFNMLSATLIALISNLFNSDPIYAVSNVVPYVTSVITDSSSYGLIQIAWQTMYGLLMLFGPTSVVLMAILSYLDIPYTTWIKKAVKLILFTIIAIFAALLITIIVI